MNGYSPCSCDYDRHPESYEHLFFKKLLSVELGKEFEEYLNVRPKLEYPIHEVKRIADIVFEFPNGWLVAHEIQLSPITIYRRQLRIRFSYFDNPKIIGHQCA